MQTLPSRHFPVEFTFTLDDLGIQAGFCLNRIMRSRDDQHFSMPDHPQSRQESLSGLIERVTFFNEDTGFVVLRVKAKGRKALLTVLGKVVSANAGEWIQAEGSWQRDRDHGMQFRADRLVCTPPTNREGIEKYLLVE